MAEAVKFLENYIPAPEKKYPGDLGLKRMQKLVELLGNPQLKYKTIHVGGTSGKGSTATMIASILGQKYKTGLHTSPHLERINERISIFSRAPHNRENEISDVEFIGLLNEIKTTIWKMEKSELGPPSYFEIVTAMAFLYFEKRKTDFAVIEVGLGGRFDATNVIKPIVSVITNIGLDHTEILGETVEEIAQDKAGIIKRGIKVVVGTDQPSVKKIILQKSLKENAKVFLMNRDFKIDTRKISSDGSVFHYIGKNNYYNLRINLLGRHQIDNAAVAIKVTEAVGGLTESDIRSGLTKAKIAGRLEIISQKPLIILDGAHNPDKMKALVGAIQEIWPERKVIVVLAIKNDKNATEMIDILKPLAQKFILTGYRVVMDQGEIVSYDTDDLAALMGQKRKVIIINDPLKAYDEAVNKTAGKDLILATGSLYLLGLIQKKINS
ncbi:hypothetical protein A3J20_06785 [Candidatus Gottesmanbacteria bacterium RIFCSPLOWO2_02_FULL_42_29]|nr:MAG: FolC bifunctional protein [Candidatus Gottesmanbacteria bacterium GW2011_GWA2_42_18]KKS75525.1 MAG: FolC bifunctional protein [Candidatus Gottesmanbacteria bacterium GW2011_GWC2_42_8]OGG36533.1 MAG: hypothetical protein A3J20_06785 [Candidatus Gottesmanbacteria bacterium RIFCSPLOWO2_02_FULL_42_29]